MSNLMLYVDGQKQFDDKRVEVLLRSMQYLVSVEREPDDFALLIARFTKSDHSNLVELKRNLQLLVLGQEGELAIEIAFYLQQGYEDPLHLIDEDYAIDLIVSDSDELHAFKEVVFSALS